jgi:hypothetical protein
VVSAEQPENIPPTNGVVNAVHPSNIDWVLTRFGFPLNNPAGIVVSWVHPVNM